MQTTTLTVDPNVVLIITTLGGIMTTLLSLWVQTYRENRKRAWEVEDRKAIADELRQAKKEVIDRHETLNQKIDRNAELTKETMYKADAAYTEANTVNQKIAELTSIFTEATAAGTKQQQDSTERLNKLESSSDSKSSTDLKEPEVTEKIEKIDKTTQATLKEVKKK